MRLSLCVKIQVRGHPLYFSPQPVQNSKLDPLPSLAAWCASRAFCRSLSNVPPHSGFTRVGHTLHPQVLLVRRAKPPETGCWSFPGGSLELGESIVDGAVREVAEETGIMLANAPAAPDGAWSFHAAARGSEEVQEAE